jgi:hypothetical protein
MFYFDYKTRTAIETVKCGNLLAEKLKEPPSLLESKINWRLLFVYLYKYKTGTNIPINFDFIAFYQRWNGKHDILKDFF